MDFAKTIGSDQPASPCNLKKDSAGTKEGTTSSPELTN